MERSLDEYMLPFHEFLYAGNDADIIYQKFSVRSWGDCYPIVEITINERVAVFFVQSGSFKL